MKKGFTLSEILITMGIIGVTAALVFPNLTAKINRNTVGISLARAVELTEKGFGDMLNVARENAPAATDVADGEELIDPGSISRLSTLQVRFFDGNPQDNAYLLDGGSLMFYAQSYIGVDMLDVWADYTDSWGSSLYSVPNLLQSPHVYKFKKINAYLIFDDDLRNVQNITDNPDVVIRRIYFDTNGSAAPNAIGEDIFLFGLTDSGHLVPAGTAAYNHNIWDPNMNNIIGPLCEGVNSITNMDDIPRLSCAARVAQDGWKITYSY